MMMASESPSPSSAPSSSSSSSLPTSQQQDDEAASATKDTKETESESTTKGACISPDEHEKVLEQVKQSEEALEQARDAEKKAKDALQAFQDEMESLSKTLKKQTADIEKSSIATEQIAKFQQEILGELSEINANSEKQFSVLKSQIEAEMQRQREKLRIDQVTAQRIEELEKEKVGYLGELKALHQLYDRLDKKYDAKMEQEEEEKLAYFAQSLDAEVAKIVGEREIEWRERMEELKNQTAATLNTTKVEAEEKLARLRLELEEKAERQVQKLEQAREKETAALNRIIDNVQQELEKALAKATQNEAEIKAEHAKELELAEENALERLKNLRTEMEDQASKEAAALKKLHDKQVADLKAEILKAQEETNQALEKSKQIDSSLKLTKEEREKQNLKNREIIEGLKKELREAHEVSSGTAKKIPPTPI